MTDKKIVIIPTYNEKENVEKMIRKVFSLEGDFNLLIVDDGSPDGTADIVKRLQGEFSDRLFIIERGNLDWGLHTKPDSDGLWRMDMTTFSRWIATFHIIRMT